MPGLGQKLAGATCNEATGMKPTTKRKVSRRGRIGEGRPSKRTPEIVTLISECIADGLTDQEAAAIADIDPDTMTEWRKDPEFSGAIKRATALRLRKRLARIEAGEPGWQGTAWALERIYPARFAKPEVLNRVANSVQINAQNAQFNFENYERMRDRVRQILDGETPMLEDELQNEDSPSGGR